MTHNKAPTADNIYIVLQLILALNIFLTFMGLTG